jgi:hypothetical protein
MAVITILGVKVNHRAGVLLMRLAPMEMLDWVAMGISGANKVPGIELLLTYLAERSKAFLKLLKIAIFCFRMYHAVNRYYKN